MTSGMVEKVRTVLGENGKDIMVNVTGIGIIR
jgi:hypothetical protein